MQLLETKNQYGSEDSVFSFQDVFFDSVKLNVYVECCAEKFLQYQKDILEDFVADFVATIQNEEGEDISNIKKTFEQSLQTLNTKFSQFAEKVHDVEKFYLKGVVQLVADNLLMTSMLWDVSLLIIRDQKILYTLENTVDSSMKIDAFSDLVEGDLEGNDQLVYIGTKMSEIIDHQDRKELEAILLEEDAEANFITALEGILLSRMDKKYLSFILSYIVRFDFNIGKKSVRKGAGFSIGNTLDSVGEMIQASGFFKKIKRKIWENKMGIVILICGVAVLFFAGSLLSQFLGKNDNDAKFLTVSGEYVNVTIDEIQAELAEFQSLDITSPEKTIKYTEITQKLDFIESKGKWLQDVKSLRSILQTEYYNGFNIYSVDNTNFESVLRSPSRILAFNSTELSRLGDLKSLYIPKNVSVLGSKGVLLDITSDNNRGTLIEYPGQTLEGCSHSLLRDGLYCYTTTDDISLITKGGVTPLETNDGSFKSGIGGLGIYNKNKFYVFYKNLSSVGNILLTRYQNIAGSESNFQGGSSYDVLIDTGTTFSTFGSFAIDGSFFGWSNKKPYLFWRSNGAWTSLSVREITMQGGDIVTQEFTDNVKIITNPATKYIFLFDQEKQLFVAYETVNPKTNTDNTSKYYMKYLFSFKFNLEGHPVIDMEISEASGDKPELYLLNDQGIYKILLSGQIKDSKEIKK